jgi:hypothetical protein
MPEIITLKCGIENCTQYYEYKYDEYGIIAITAQWRNEQSKNGIWAGLLPEKPSTGEKYELFIQTAIKIDLSEKFWVIYFEPYSAHEGLDTENGICSIQFCLCNKISVKEIGISAAKIEIEVLKTVDIQQYVGLPATINEISTHIDEQINSSYYSIVNFEKYSLISINYQSDLGWNYIIGKKDGKSKIIAENHWDFHQDIWKIVHEDITKEQEEKYGIQY